MSALPGLTTKMRVALIESENPTWEDLAEDWGKSVEFLKPLAVAGKADPSLRS